MSIPFFRTASREIPLDHVLWMAVVNATPDSFSDGGRVDVVGHAISLWEQGADILDIGGESTRPGSTPISAREEIERIKPVIFGIWEYWERKKEAGICRKPLLSVDTYHPETAEFAVQNGVEILNDVAGAENPEMICVAVDTGVALCFMHQWKHGSEETQRQLCGDVTDDVFTYLETRRDALIMAGIDREKLIADPGIGFGKTQKQNWELVENVHRFQALNLPILVGHSRKRFLQTLLDTHPDLDRDDATAIVSHILIDQGVSILRTHVKRTFQKLMSEDGNGLFCPRLSCMNGPKIS